MTTADNDLSTESDADATHAAAGTAPDGTGPTAEAATEATPTAAVTTPGGSGTTNGAHLVPDDAVMDFRSRWQEIQQGFVDDPWSAVKDADGLVGDVLEKLAAILEEQRRRLAGQWSDGEPDTEQLRLTLRQYRDLLDHLLTN